jgi:hypothetical protein
MANDNNGPFVHSSARSILESCRRYLLFHRSLYSIFQLFQRAGFGITVPDGCAQR